MRITDYIINIKDSTLADRLRLRQVLLDNNQKLNTALLTSKTIVNGALRNSTSNRGWGGTYAFSVPNISITDFIQKFKKSDKLNNLAFSKRSGTAWTIDECRNIFNFVGDEGSLPKTLNNTPITQDVHENYYNWNTPEGNSTEVFYEDVFTTHECSSPSSEAPDSIVLRLKPKYTIYI